ncbi:MAG: corrinoid protein [Deltaproteobacteria bacterium]|nr:corrinoid protein [Deltaproteobacteria bacterium]
MPLEILERLSRAIVDLNTEKTERLSREALAAGIDPLDIINTGIRTGMDTIGEKYQRGQAFLPELMIAARVTEAALAVIEPELVKGGTEAPTPAKVVMSTVRGDIHDIGKNIVVLLMKAAGFMVHDLGVDQPAESIVQKARDLQVDVIGLSALLTTTVPRMKDLIDILTEEGIRDRFKVIIGGAPVSQEFADSIGADGYGPDAARAVELVKKLVQNPPLKGRK